MTYRGFLPTHFFNIFACCFFNIVSVCVFVCVVSRYRLDVYHTRLERLQNATLVRTRWYGDKPNLSGVHGDNFHQQQQQQQHQQLQRQTQQQRQRQHQRQAAANFGSNADSNSDNGSTYEDDDAVDNAGEFDDRGDVFVERKTHHESWSLDGSVKERFRLDRPELAGYLSGRVVL
jgi:SPX domain protein involved in polyphosphate accumulation